MLILGRTSACDVCLEPYTTELFKTPHVIPCGHVFCLDCLHHLRPVNCPLCRQSFDPRDPKKLILDIASAHASPDAVPASVERTNSDSAAQEGKRLQDAIAKVVSEGSTEPHLRSLIDECNTFLRSQPRPLYNDLRISVRLITYLGETKSKLNGQMDITNKLNDTVAELETAKKAAEKKFTDLRFEKEAERAVALATEQSLREHCNYLQDQYNLMSERYKQVMLEWGRLNAEVDRLRESQGLSPEDSSSDDHFRLPGSADLDPAAMRDLKGKAADPAYYISPLPQYSSVLPSTLKGFPPLPEVDLDFEVDEKAKLEAHRRLDLNLPSVACGGVDCPYSCGCVPTLNQLIARSASRAASSPHDTQLSTPTPPSSATAAPEHPTPPLPSPSAARTPSGLSLTAPRAAPRPRSRSPSPIPTRPVSPARASSSQRPRGWSTAPELAPLRDTDAAPLRSRLHELLDNPVAASLPNMPGSHFPQDRPTRPAFAPAHKSLSASAQAAPVSASGLSATAPQRPQMISHASSAALALEKAQRAEKERQREERERNRSEGERERERERDRRDSAERRADTASVSSSLPREPTLSRSGSITSSHRGKGPGSAASSIREGHSSSSSSRPIPTTFWDSAGPYTSTQRYTGSGSSGKSKAPGLAMPGSKNGLYV